MPARSKKPADLRLVEQVMINPPEGQFRVRIGIGTEPGFLKLGPEWDSPDHVLDTRAMPWPIDDSVVDTLYVSFYFHRLDPADRRAFMDEAWRVLKPGAQLIVVVPHWSSMRAISDPLAEWPPLCESSFMPYSKAWREQEKMTEDLPLACDFGPSYGYGTTLDPDVEMRNDDYKGYARKHLLNASQDLHLTMTCVK